MHCLLFSPVQGFYLFVMSDSQQNIELNISLGWSHVAWGDKLIDGTAVCIAVRLVEVDGKKSYLLCIQRQPEFECFEFFSKLRPPWKISPC